jgi:hypothetical protein
LIGVSEALTNYHFYKEMDLNSDEFQSTLDVDLILRKLYQFDEISIKDIESLQLLLAGFSFRKISLMISLDRKTTAKRLTALIKRVGDLYYA